MTAETSNAPSSLSSDDYARLATLRDLLWTDYGNIDKCAPKDDPMPRQEWDWITSLVKNDLVTAAIASGFDTPVRFCLVLETENEPLLLMVGPMHVPTELGSTTEQIKALFRELRDCD